MRKPGKLTPALSIATAILLQSCSSSESTSATPSEVNTKAPELNASWATKCIVTSSGTSTTTSASGGGSGSVSGGSAFITMATFNANGSATLSTEIFATSDCNANASISFNKFNINYFIGDATQANDGSQATNIQYLSTNGTSYSIFQVVNNISLFLGDIDSSTTGHDGSSDVNRFDGLGPELNKL